jgi:hypothetical protein
MGCRRLRNPGIQLEGLKKTTKTGLCFQPDSTRRKVSDFNPVVRNSKGLIVTVVRELHLLVAVFITTRYSLVAGPFSLQHRTKGIIVSASLLYGSGCSLLKGISCSKGNKPTGNSFP